VAAAVQNPAALKAIIAVAPVISAYEDWHYGGVPNGENALSPVAYQALGTPFDAGSGSPLQYALAASGGSCYPHMVAEANDPRALFNTFYYDRDFKLGAPHVEAAVLFTQGFEDANVKSAMIPGWFNPLPGPKLGVFGHWLHQHPARMDQEVLFVAWMDQYVKGRDLGFDRIPNVVVNVDVDRHRTADAWPPTEPVVSAFYPNFAGDALATEPSSGSATVTLEPAGVEQAAPAIVLRGPVPGETSLAGEAQLHVRGSFTGLVNAYMGATLVEERADGTERLLTWGQFNLAHRYGHDRYAPLTPGEAIAFSIPLRATEHVIAGDSTLRLEVRGVGAASAIPNLGLAGQLTLQGGPDGTWLEIPGVDLDEYEAMPITARP
jgi:predicted acyl esterase